MKLHILFDLHLEFAPHLADPYAIQTADVVVLAGDVHTGTQGIAWARQSFPSKHIVYVAGNHEFYGYQWDQLLDQLRDEARAHCVHFLENDAITIEGVRFLGATLWTDFDYFGRGKRHASMLAAEMGINDFRRISAEPIHPLEVARILGISDELKPVGLPRKLSAVHTLERHQASMAWLKRELPQGERDKTVVITHHYPHANSCAPVFTDDLTTAVFGSHVEADVLLGAKLWIHGHTHGSCNYRVRDADRSVQVVCNPRGYPARWPQGEFENKLFNPNLIEVV